GQAGAEDFRHHRLGHAEHADARGDIETKHDPQEVELRRLHGLVDGDRMCRNQGPRALRRRVARGHPAGRRQAIGERRDEHDDEIQAPEHEKRLRYTHAARADQVEPRLAWNDHFPYVRGHNLHYLAFAAVHEGIAYATARDQGEVGGLAEVCRRFVEEVDEVGLERNG